MGSASKRVMSGVLPAKLMDLPMGISSRVSIMAPVAARRMRRFLGSTSG